MTAEEQEQHRRKLQKQLDEALADSFPASDPVSIVTSQEEEDWGEPAERDSNSFGAGSAGAEVTAEPRPTPRQKA
ncbi:MAG: hypothetical protein JO042_17080 [Sinobacteraceae bacterium]|nr:hypothetical protein [Nevskiaceae bacterium]